MKVFRKKILMAPEGDPPAGDATPPAEPTPAPKPDEKVEHWQAENAKAQAENFMLKKKIEEITGQHNGLQQQIDGWNKDPISAYRAAGGDLDQLTQTMLSEGNPDPEHKISQVEAMLTKINDRLDGRDKAEKETAAQKEKDSYFYDHAQEVKKILDGEEFGPASKLLEFYHEAFGTDTIQGLLSAIRPRWEHEHQTTGRSMTPSDSAKAVLAESIELVKKLKGSKALPILLEHARENDNQAEDPNKEPPPRSLQNSLEGQNAKGKVDPSTMSDAEFRDWSKREYAARSRSGQQ